MPNTLLLVQSLPRFLPCLVKDDFPQDQYYAAFALTNIAAGTSENTKLLIDHGAVPILALGNIAVVINHGSLQCLLSLLTHDHNKSIKQEACRTVSNITAGNREQIQAVIEAGLIAPLVDLLQFQQNVIIVSCTKNIFCWGEGMLQKQGTVTHGNCGKSLCFKSGGV
ncbi:armadillo/beta-catenin-like repeat protein [Medicago truncatula]|uniref:Armadillo/beta-catenin-like repeat protein n=1 Tax=Medicago truncatula TaxID=3880 RepID=G7JR37_MEDTR|nr:armadillo/beta-catenin-like repeat protein [Medicago truncatula]